jgi:hypothetical protein
MAIKSKVLSVRLSLEALQSCFDLCEVLGHPTNGASGAIARTVEVLTRDLRSKNTIPSYRVEELEILVSSFIASKNPTSMPSFERLSSNDFDPTLFKPKQPVGMLFPEDYFEQPIEEEKPQRTHRQVQDDQEEYNELLEEKIREQMAIEDAELLAKILIGG